MGVSFDTGRSSDQSSMVTDAGHQLTTQSSTWFTSNLFVMANPVSVSTSVHAPAQGQASVSSGPTHDYVKSQKRIKHKVPTQVYNVVFFPLRAPEYHPGIG
jgi:hypothetical protein